MKRQGFIVIAVVLAVATGFAIYHRVQSRPVDRDSAPSVSSLWDASAVVPVGNVDQAADSTSQPAQSQPADWQGYYKQAQAHFRLGQYAQARVDLAQAAKLAPQQVEVPLLLAQTYSLPASQKLLSPGVCQKPADIGPSLEGLAQACRILQTVSTAEPKLALTVTRDLGLCTMRMAQGNIQVARRLRMEAQVAMAGDDRKTARQKIDQAAAAAGTGLAMANQGTDYLLQATEAIAKLMDATTDKALRQELEQMLSQTASELQAMTIQCDNKPALDKHRGLLAEIP